MVLVMLDGTEVTLSETSSADNMTTVVKTWGDVAALKISKENVEGGTLNDEPLDDRYFTGASARMDENGDNISVSISTRKKTAIEKIQEEQEMQNAMINSLLGGDI